METWSCGWGDSYFVTQHEGFRKIKSTLGEFKVYPSDSAYALFDKGR